MTDAAKAPMELELFSNTYRIGTLDAVRQFHVTRKLGPVLTGLMEGREKARESKDADGEDAFLKMLSPVIEQIGKLTQEDSEYVLFTCLSCVSRKVADEKWVRVMNGNRLQFEDIKMPAMMRLAFEVIKENLGDFFAVLP